MGHNDLSNDSKDKQSNDASVLQSNMRNYQQLVNELLKTKPEEKLIKSLMQSLSLKYTETHIDRLSAVLAFNPISHKDENRDL